MAMDDIRRTFTAQTARDTYLKRQYLEVTRYALRSRRVYHCKNFPDSKQTSSNIVKRLRHTCFTATFLVVLRAQFAHVSSVSSSCLSRLRLQFIILRRTLRKKVRAGTKRAHRAKLNESLFDWQLVDVFTCRYLNPLSLVCSREVILKQSSKASFSRGRMEGVSPSWKRWKMNERRKIDHSLAVVQGERIK